MGRAIVKINGRFKKKISEIFGVYQNFIWRLPIIGQSDKMWKTNIFLKKSRIAQFHFLLFNSFFMRFFQI